MEKLISLGYNHYLALFDSLLPPLFHAYDALPTPDLLKTSLKEPIDLLKSWDKKSAESSVATTIAIEWAYQLIYSSYSSIISETARDQVSLFTSFAKKAAPGKNLQILAAVVDNLEKIYGTWKVPWGDINRFQRPTGNVYETFDDEKESLPVGMASSLFGSLPAYETSWNGTKKGYGVAGNSFVAVVEFGKRLKAKAIIAGGQSFDPASKHFTDQASLYAEGKFRDVLFYKEDVLKGTERRYNPGEDDKR
jgi:acyl-homoserine lactone acylase PvdQ